MNAAVIYGTFSPFHEARIEAAGALGQRRGHHLTGVEVASRAHDYAWPQGTAGGTHFDRTTLFPDADYFGVSPVSLQPVLWKELDRLRPDVLVLPGWGLKEAQAGLVWALARRTARVIISDSQPIDNPRHPLKEWVKRRLVRRFQAGFAGGSPHVRYLVQLGLPRERCFVGCDVVDNNWIAKETRRWKHALRTRPNGPTLLSCLRLLPSKNVVGALRAFAAHRADWSWLIAGHGPERARIERAIRAYDLEGRVHLLGHTTYGYIPRLLAQVDAYFQPSSSEPWGLAVNEAMAAGLPVLVSSRCGCREDLVQDGVNGLTFDPLDAASIAAALHALRRRESEWAEMGAASKRIISNWGLSRYANGFWRACHAATEAAATMRFKAA